ncbi:MAG: sigma-54-dependent Fis family transcriptional regulator [Candidatus Marinimicrobia bacterium]|nr:sigma-54-dependent Fis family transcriptional regulator [Candidatus Neomarinimicrobiota bacterium]
MINSIDKVRRSVGIIGESPPMIEMLSLIGQVANTDITVLVTAPSGCGKEMAAKAIHKNSRRKFESLVVVNCAAIPSGIIESELFGHKKGSFTGAIDDKKGYFEQADKGSIFLDEIGELPKETQAKLLRVIESGEFMRVGESKTNKVDVRIIAATNRDLKKEVEENNFREDLYFRLKTINIKVPALKEHLNDIPLYIERFGLEFTNENNITFKGFSSEAISLLKKYNWPGNVRELKNVVEGLLVMNKGQRIVPDMVELHLNLDNNIDDRDFPIKLDENSDKLERELILKQLLFLRQDINELKQTLYNKFDIQDFQPTNPSLLLPAENNNINADSDNFKNIEDAKIKGIKDDVVGELTMEELEVEVIERYLKKFKNNRRKTAKALDISERTLYRKIKQYDL